MRRMLITMLLKRNQILSFDTYRCTICNFKANWRSSVCRHIRNVHSTNDYTGLLEGTRRFFNGETKPLDIVCLSVEKKDKEPTEFRTPTPSVSSEPDVEDNSDKKHKCTICPYRTAKPNLLKFHMSCHKPQPGVVQEKCKFCPYYVVAKRLLHQHMRLHMQEMHNRQKEATLQKSATPVKKSSIFQSTTPGTVTPKKYKCNNCPYQSNSKNDILYHKQFHRQRPSCEFKCDYCDYWVTHRRLIRQHMKVHDNAPSPALSSSAQSSPTKSDITESSAIHDTVQLAMYKQRMISAKIAPSISQKPVMSPMKIACSVGNKSGYALKNGVYRKMHKCSKCPYMNLRLRNLRLHELMHGNRKSKTPLQKCPHCDYSVGSKGLLSHHLKVHQPGYMMAITDVSAPEIGINGTTHDDEEVDSDENNSDTADITMETKADTLFEIAKFKKYSCEKCPYASAKRSHYERHVSLHGSKQRCQCKYCDYSVPSNNLLAQHMKLHMSPNQNLLAVQSLSNLQLLEEVPADVALASALPPLDRKGSFSVSITHDHMDLYENSPELDIEPKKLYRCDRCPYANVRRDHLLAHLKFHMIKSELVCPYCDYSVAKQHLLTQHIRVHFCPLPELSNWLVQNGEMERMKLSKDPDISEALFVAELYRTDGCGKSQSDDESNENVKAEESADVENKDDKVKLQENDIKEEQTKETEVTPSSPSNAEPFTGSQEEKILEDEKADTKADDKVDVKADDGVDDEGRKTDEYICQYCDREFPSSDILVKHEMQHLIGNNYEEYMAQIQQMADISDEEEGEDVLMEDAQSDTVAPPGDGMSDGSSSPDEDENYHDEIRLIDDIPLEDEIHDDECQQYEQKENISQVDNGTIDSINDSIDDDDDEISFKIDDEISFKIDDVTNTSKNEDSSVIGDENSAVIDDKGSAVISNEEQMDVEDDVAEKENVE
ncbi:hypothetical protein FSP39_021048 [Pinctada imbricata]|uniref:C2H2-type domain-containing protein n=1 Tax=Pinctada imbricata TaxID=66713 RepID=A0AA88XJ33_PINIB|nr:hypothetical protein FSP39_021048 [Pinctada imbricata]